MLVKSKLFNDYHKNYIYIILSYGFFLGWITSFPYNGPLFEFVSGIYNFNADYYALTYIGIPAVFLAIFGFVKTKEKYPKRLVIYSIILCMATNLLLFLGVSYWYPIFTIMGITSVLFVIGWSYFFTTSVSFKDKIKVMGLTMVIGNLIFYINNLLINMNYGTIAVFISLFINKVSIMINKNAVVKKIIESHKGSLDVKSSINVGSEFSFSIPVQQTI